MVAGGRTKKETQREEDSSYYLWKSRANLTNGATGVFPVSVCVRERERECALACLRVYQYFRTRVCPYIYVYSSVCIGISFAVHTIFDSGRRDVPNRPRTSARRQTFLPSSIECPPPIRTAMGRAQVYKESLPCWPEASERIVRSFRFNDSEHRRDSPLDSRSLPPGVR